MSTLRPLKTRNTAAGFTLLEMLVSLFLTSTVMALVIGAALNLRNTYYTDIKRTQINGNLRSAMDIMSMNVRQGGENLLAAFPAILLTDGALGAPDTLTLRRSNITEVLTLCADTAIGATTVDISSASLSNAECIPANVAPVYTIFTGELAQTDGTPRVYIYDKAQKLGEFADFVTGHLAGGQYSLTVGSLSRAYTRLSTSIYVLEEFQFSLNSAEQRLELTVNGDATQVRPVAFNVTNFQVMLTLDDNSYATSLLASSTKDWKDIRAVDLYLTGQDMFKGHVVTSSIQSRFFPRNVLSYEGG